MLRWLLVLFTGLVLLGSSVTSWAAAGIVGDTECCCPVKSECRCHDHDGKSSPAPLLKKCGGQAELVSPMVVHALAPAAPSITALVQVIAAILLPPLPLPDLLPREPETPPF